MTAHDSSLPSIYQPNDRGLAKPLRGDACLRIEAFWYLMYSYANARTSILHYCTMMNADSALAA